ncbi:putative strictosidine synthase transcription factor WD40-like family [Helianthus debilis subsp. tardiflorus]
MRKTRLVFIGRAGDRAWPMPAAYLVKSEWVTRCGTEARSLVRSCGSHEIFRSHGVGFNDGLATQLSGGYNYLSGIDVESYTRNVYMTDASLTHDSTGRLFKYNPRTQRVTVLMSGLAGAGGPAVSSDRKYILVPDYYVNKKIQRYWLQGPKRGTNEIVMTNSGSPNIIRVKGVVTFLEYVNSPFTQSDSVTSIHLNCLPNA